MKRLFLVGSRLAGLVVTGAAAGLIVFGKSFIRLWTGEAYVSGPWAYRSDVVMLVLLCAYFPRLMQSISWQLLLASRSQSFLMWLCVGEAVANLTLSVILARWIGLVGVAIGTTIPLLITHVFFLPVYVLKKFDIPLTEYLRDGIGPPIITGTLMFGVAWLLVGWHDPRTWTWFFFEVALSSLAGALFAFTVGITRHERRDFLRRFGLAS